MIPLHKTVIEDPMAEIPGDPDAKMTGEQADILRALCEKADEPFDGNLTQAQAEQRIDALEAQLDT